MMTKQTKRLLKWEDKQWLPVAKQGCDSDEKVKQIKEQVQKHPKGDISIATATSSTTSNNSDAEFA